MPLRPIVARTDKMHPTTRLYPLTAAQGILANDFVHLSSNAIVRTTAADPAALLGISEESSETAEDLHPGYMNVTVFTADLALKMKGDRAPLVTDINVAYNIARDADGVWTVDTSATDATRVFVIDVDLENDWFIVKVLAANRQSPE